jgi:hypothetical protein
MTILFGKTSNGLIVPVLVDEQGIIQTEGTMSIIGHNLLDGDIHPDTVQGTPQEGDVIIGIDQGAGVIKWQRLAKGSTGQVLTVQSDGSLAWQDASGGDVVLISDQLISSDVASISFSSIPSTYKHLRLVGSARTSTAIVGEFIRAQFNGDTGNNYDSFYAYIHHSGLLSTGELIAQTSARIATCAGNSAASGDVSAFETQFPSYSTATFTKSFVAPTSLVTARSSGNLNIYYVSGQWRGTNAISSIVLTAEGGGNFKAGSRISLYGMK